MIVLGLYTRLIEELESIRDSHPEPTSAGWYYTWCEYCLSAMSGRIIAVEMSLSQSPGVQ